MNNITHFANNDRLDRFGAAASLACAVHCAVTPLVIGLLPLVGLSFLADKQTEWVFVLVALGVGVVSLLPSYLRRHRRLRPLLLFTAGATTLLGVRLYTALLLKEESRLELPAVVIGALLIAGAHLINRRLCRSCSHC